MGLVVAKVCFLRVFLYSLFRYHTASLNNKFCVLVPFSIVYFVNASFVAFYFWMTFHPNEPYFNKNGLNMHNFTDDGDLWVITKKREKFVLAEMNSSALVIIMPSAVYIERNCCIWIVFLCVYLFQEIYHKRRKIYSLRRDTIYFPVFPLSFWWWLI